MLADMAARARQNPPRALKPKDSSTTARKEAQATGTVDGLDRNLTRERDLIRASVAPEPPSSGDSTEEEDYRGNDPTSRDLEPESEEESIEDYIPPEAIRADQEQREEMEREIREVAEELSQGHVEVPAGGPIPQKT